MHARARLLTLVLIGVVAGLTLFAAIDSGNRGRTDVRFAEDGADAVRLYRVVSAPPGAPLKRGDRVAVRAPAQLARLRYDDLRRGATMVVDRLAPSAGRVVVAVDRDAPKDARFRVGVAIVVLFLAVATVVAVRGTSSGSLSLAASFATFGLLVDPMSPSWPDWLVAAYAPVVNVPIPLSLLFAVDFATRFTGGGTSPANRRLRRWVWFAGTGLLLIEILATAATYANDTLPGIVSVAIVGPAALVTSAFLVALVRAYVSAPDAERQRALWVVGSLGVGAFGLLVAIALEFAGFGEGVALYPLLLIVAMPLGCAYAILRFRLLDIGFVLNRATVYGVTSLLVLAALALVDYALQQLLGSWLARTGLYVQLGLALAIGIATRPLHARVDAVVDDLFFRERHAAERALRAFAHDVAFIDDADAVLSRTVVTVARAARLRCVAFVAHDREFRFAAASDGGTFARIERNDAAVVRMLATRGPVDLRDVETSLAGQFAFPMFARNRLVGVLVCGERDDGANAYAPDELDAIAAVARATGVALDIIRIDALECEVDTLRRGSRPALAVD